MAAVRPAILRRFYEATYAAAESRALPVLRECSTFDEYVALRRIFSPDVSERACAAHAPKPEWRALEGHLPEDFPDEKSREVLLISRRKELDLGKIGRAPACVSLHDVATLTNLEALARLPNLRELDVDTADTPSPARLPARLPLERLALNDCGHVLVDSLLASTSCRAIEIVFWGGGPFDAAPFAAHRELARLLVRAPLVLGARALSGLPLVELTLSKASVDGELCAALATMKGLFELSLSSLRPFGPRDLPLDGLRALRILGVSAFPSYKKEWIDWAVARPEVACRFNPPPDPKKSWTISVEEVYRNVAILRLEKPGKLQFEVSGDLADGDNGVLEEALRPVAKKAKKKVAWSSASDTFVARTPDLETARWVIDEARAR